MKSRVLDKMFVLITAAFGLVAALAWNEAIQTIFKRIFGDRSSISAMLIYAVAVTIVAVIVATWVGKIMERFK